VRFVRYAIVFPSCDLPGSFHSTVPYVAQTSLQAIN
jgi:hypothetical protein